MKHLVWTVLLMAFAGGCATVRMESTHDPKVNFDQYNSFCWLRGCDFKYQGDLDSMAIVQIKTAIEQEMVRKGMVQDENNPDILLDFHVWLKEGGYEKILFINDYDFWPEYEPETYMKGSLIIDIADGKTSAMVWQSTTRRYMDPDEEISPKAIRRSVRKALRDFPPDKEELASNPGQE